MAGLAGTVDVITWLGATFVSVGIRSIALSSLVLMLGLLLLLLTMGAN
jgi:hypothetical protein